MSNLFKIFQILVLSILLLACSKNKRVEYILTSQEIYSEFQVNEVAALAKYKGKKIRVSGTLISFENIMGANYCFIGSPGDFFGEVECAMSEDFVKRAGEFKKGQEISIEGICYGVDWKGVVQLK